MRIYKLKAFSKWAKDSRLNDKALLKAVAEIENDLVEANLGASVYKKRIAVGNKGKSGSVRTILAFKSDLNTFFLFGFNKNEKDNLDKKELKAIKQLAKYYLALDSIEITQLLKSKDLIEVKKNGK